MFLIVIHLFVSVCRAVTPSFDRLKNHGSRCDVSACGCHGVTALQDRDYRTTNFRVSPAKVMKYMPLGNDETLICWVSAVIWPVNRVWPMRLVILNSE